MGERTDYRVAVEANDPPAIRAEMAKTRSALEQKLGELKSRFTDPDPASKKRNTTVAKKKKSAAKSSARKKSSRKGKTGASMKRTAGKVARKATEVVGDVLRGAASGAAKGAAEVVEEKARATKGAAKRKK
jgi:hypothetical protein